MHPHSSSALRYASAAQAVHSRVYGGCTAEAAASEASGPRVSGCIRVFGDFNPYPVIIKRYQKGCQVQPLASIVTLEEGSFNWRNMMMAWVTYQSTHCQRDGIGNSSAFAQKPDFDRYGPGSRTLSDPLPSPLRCSRDMPLPHGACLRHASIHSSSCNIIKKLLWY